MKITLSPYGGWVRFGDPLPDNVVRDRRGRKRELRTPKARLERQTTTRHSKGFSRPRYRRWARRPRQEPSITSTSISGAGRCGRSLSKIPLKAPASSASSVRRAISMATLSLECASISVGSATRFGFSTSAARDAGRAKMSNVFAIQTPVAIAVAFRAGEVETDKPCESPLCPD